MESSQIHIVLPGETIAPELIPAPPDNKKKSKPLTLGPGLRHLPPSTVHAAIAGELCIDQKKRALWVENAGGRYTPTVGDLVIATVHHSSVDFYHCTIAAHAPLAALPQLAFENVTRKTRPMLQAGALVYARVTVADRYVDPEIECVHPTTGKADGLGPLKGGMLFDVSIGMARRLMAPRMKEQGGLVLMELLAEKIPFEIAVGRNGRLWASAAGGSDGGIRETLAVGRAVVEADTKGLNLDGQKKLVHSILKDF